MSESHPSHADADILANLVATLLAPLFLAATNGDLTRARLAAASTIASYCARTNADLIAVAQIIAFGLTALASLSQSTDPELPLPLALRLRGTANACNRSAEQNRRARAEKPNHPEPVPAPPKPSLAEPRPTERDPAELIAKIAETQQRTADHLASLSVEAHQQQHDQATWAAGTAQVAAETAAEIANLPPEERRSAAIWADILNRLRKKAGSIPLAAYVECRKPQNIVDHRGFSATC
jgi:hypothetical protein